MEEKRKDYKCPTCKESLGVETLNVGSQPLYKMVDHPKTFVVGNDLELWGLALLLNGSFTSRDLYEKYLEGKARHNFLYEYLTEEALKEDHREVMHDYLNTVEKNLCSGNLRVRKRRRPVYAYSGIRARIQKWVKSGWIVKSKETRKPQLIKCPSPSCGRLIDPQGLIGSFSSERKVKASVASLSACARPMHVAKKQLSVWKVINEYGGEFMAKKIHELAPDDVSLSTVRLEIRKGVADGKLEEVSFGTYRRKEDEQSEQ